MKDVTVEEFVTFLNENDLKHMHSNSEYEEEVNEHIAHKHKRITIPMLEAYVKFPFRDDIKNILEDETIDLKNRVMKVVKMYKDETNEDILLNPATKQIGKWKMIDNMVAKMKGNVLIIIFSFFIKFIFLFLLKTCDEGLMK